MLYPQAHPAGAQNCSLLIRTGLTWQSHGIDNFVSYEIMNPMIKQTVTKSFLITRKCSMEHAIFSFVL